MIRLFQANAVALDGLYHLLDSRILCNHRRFQLLLQVLQTNTLRLFHTLYGNTRHHRNHLGHLFLCNHLALFVLSVCPFLLQHQQILLKLQLLVAIARSQLKVLTAHGQLFLLLGLCNLLLHFRNLRWNDSMLQVRP